MKTVMKAVLSTVLLALGTAAQAATFEEGMRLKKEQRLEQAATAFSEVTAREPKNLAAWEQLAIVQSWLNRYDASIASWRKALALQPGKAENHAGLARVLYWKGDHDGALRELNGALKIAPRDADALALKGDVLMAAGKPAEARAAYQQARAIRGDDPALDKKIANAVGPARWRLDVGYTADHYTELRDAENSSFVQLGYTASPAATVYVRGEHLKNFGTTDDGITLGGYFLPASWLLLNAEIGATPDEVNFRAKQQGLLNAEFLLKGGVQPLLGFRYLKYDEGDVTTITPGLRVLAGITAIEARYGYSKNTDDSKTSVAQARIAFDFDSVQPYIAYADGEEALPPLAKADIKVAVAGCVFNLSPSWGARLDFTHEDRKDFYIHNAIGGGLTYKF